MKVSGRIIGIILVLLSVIGGYHWYFAHLMNDQLVPELGISIIGTAIFGLLFAIKKLEVKN
jgi:hypothetical protein